VGRVIGTPEWQLDRGLRTAGINLATTLRLDRGKLESLTRKPLTLNPFTGILNT
jgi:hypothetical protein